MKKTLLGRLGIPGFLSPVRTGFLYLLLMFLVFSLGFIKLIYSIPMALILAWVAVKYWKNTKEDSVFSFLSKKDFLMGSSLLFLWVLLSGIGGFAFQNPDFHGRNALFRDLIAMKWPVIYTYPGQDSNTSYGFTYYIGFWLPSALIGKLLGWKMANAALFIWTFLGVHIAASLLMKKTRLSFTQSALLFIFFSGMDFAGVLLKRALRSDLYPNIWPPIQHLEWWAPGLQFSSFSTQLFWVFNQAIPAWIALLITINLTSKKSIFLIFALCVFLAPIPAIGFFFILLLMALTNRNREDSLINQLRNGRLKNFTKIVSSEIRVIITLENVVGGGIILITTLIYYSSSSGEVPRQIGVFNLGNIFIHILFALFEWFVLWLALFNRNKKNLFFYVVGLFLLVSPLIRLSERYAISKRATIPMLLMLMVWCGEYLRFVKGRRRVIMIMLLVIGALTPLYEINRSIFRTFIYHLENRESSPTTHSLYPPNSNMPPFPSRPELDHPGELVADEFYTLSVFNPERLGTKIGPTSDSIFYRYLARQ